MFWVFQVLRHYCNMLKQKDTAYRREIPDLMTAAAELERAVGPIDIVFGHNDLLAANFN